MKHNYQKQWAFLVFSCLALNACVKKQFSSSAPTAETAGDSTPAVETETPAEETIMEADASPEVDAVNPPAMPDPETTVEESTAVLLPQTQAGGVLGGHFDLDTSINTYKFDEGKTCAHTHEYDDKFNVTGVDFFNLLDPKQVSPSAVIVKDQGFKIIVANTQLSPGARVTINGRTYLATDWQKRSLSGDLPVFSLAGGSGTQKLTDFAIAFDPQKAIAGQLIPTETTLVRSNAQGPGGSYRAGALTIQLIDAKDGKIDPTLGVAKVGVTGLLWEATLFWHEKASP